MVGRWKFWVGFVVVVGDRCGGNSVTLYAVWKSTPPTLEKFKCSSLSSNSTGNATNGEITYPIRKVGSQCWMWRDYGTNLNWSAANTFCPSGWHLPSASEFQALIDAIGADSQLNEAGWSAGYYWSSSASGNGGHTVLEVRISKAFVNTGIFVDNFNSNVRCVSS